ncbi:TolC family protein [Fulvivirgaceae bacterium BMA12]|uniref:TolC family protein n=1 Tax=Agaribacillus aureus TaxID=3051825 RepID=A0ABT8LEM1_9BACT|nr:TolC family protein [Fulvivirgaceae bacterium BMA12]
MSKKLRIFCLIVFLIPCLKAQEILSLKDAVAIGLENNFDIKIAEKDQQINSNNNSLGNAGFLPTVDLSVDKTFQTQDVELEIQGSEGTFDVNRDGAKSDRFNAGANFNWTIFDGFAMFIARDRLVELESQGLLKKKVTVENTIAAIYNTYYQIVFEQDRLAVLNETLEISEARRAFAKSRYEVGKGSKLNYLTAQVDYNTDQSNVLRQEELLNNARIDLNLLLGRDSKAIFQASESIDVNPALQLELLLQKVSDLNPSLLSAISDQNVAFLEYKELAAERYPKLNLGLSYNQGTSNNDAGQLRSSTINGISYGFTASWNIFDGFNKTREIQNAKIQREISQLEKESLELSLRGAVNAAFINYSNNLKLIGLEEANVTIALENGQIALDRYELGAGTSLELREAQRNAVDSQNRLLDARLNAKLAEIELLRLSGSILTSVAPN